ncbi:zinc-dependent alcohol dehydrogenase [Tuberibacillus calidus]|jgi:threonine dehydrogenase-like Zn-dependent dehydrogenase|uniref:zinc-dependent alcohol dehydrogenase n=1 Tax=Tuberibacillus calidus TaxID=340097 RepID=UPI0004253908|nr:alcohol dehydrogenase catalytic domain-containing protein [Tuberibacillus calidus]
MKAIVKNSAEPFDISIKELDLGIVGNKDVLVKVSAVGICGSDLHMYAGHGGYDWIQYPLVFGHEITGTVVKVGADIDGSLVGQRVVINPYIACGHCEFCLKGEENRCDSGEFFAEKRPPKSLQYGFRKNGGMSEFLIVPEKNIIILENNISDEVGAILEAIAVGVTAVEKINRIDEKSIAVFGPGPIGLAIVSILSGLHVKKLVVAGVSGDEQRLEKAKELGAHETVILGENATEDLLSFNTAGFDSVFDSSGHHSVPKTAVSILKKGGEMILVGISNNEFSLPMDQVVRGEIQIKGSYGITNESFRKTVAYAAKQEFPFEKLITGIFSYNQAKEAFQNALNRAPGKTIITFK